MRWSTCSGTTSGKSSTSSRHSSNTSQRESRLGLRQSRSSISERCDPEDRWTAPREIGHSVDRIDSIGKIPPLDPALVDEPPAVVAEFRSALRNCDAVLIAAPEYAAGVAGSTKNGLDWLVGDSTIYRKVIGVATAGTTGGPHAIEQLVRTISWQGGWPLATLSIAAPRTKSDEHGEFNDSATVSEIEAWVDTVLRAVSGSPRHRRELVARVVSRFGIDPSRFGDFEDD